MDIGTKKEPGRMLTAEEILQPAGGHILPTQEEDPTPPDGTLDPGGVTGIDYATDR